MKYEETATLYNGLYFLHFVPREIKLSGEIRMYPLWTCILISDQFTVRNNRVLFAETLKVDDFHSHVCGILTNEIVQIISG